MTILVMVIAILFPHLPACAQGNGSMIDGLNKTLGVKLPAVYQEKLDSFLAANKIMKDEGSAKFTADFIVKQMQSDWWISKQSQLLFVWTHIYNEITGTYLYDWSDWDENRLNEYGNVVDSAEKCWKDFRTWYIEYTKEISAEADRQSAEADRQSAEAKKEIINITNTRLNNLIKFYNLYKKDPSSVKQSEIDHMKKSAKEITQDCKQYNISYKTKLSKEMLKFYGIE